MSGSNVIGTGGSGGGFLEWRVGDLIELEGWLALRGYDGSGSNSGGGSGGSVLIKTFNMSGVYLLFAFCYKCCFASVPVQRENICKASDYNVCFENVCCNN